MQLACNYNIPVGYREISEFDVLTLNWNLYKIVAEADPSRRAPSTKGRLDQQASIMKTSSPANQLAGKKQCEE